MPKDISKEHDRYVFDFVNQKKSSIYRTGSLTSFGLTKTGKLKMVSVIVKLEYLMTDDIYLAGYIVPHPKNKSILILSNLNGKIVSMNRKASKLLGNAVVDHPYSLFLSIPLLMKYFYPSLEGHLRYKQFSPLARKNRESRKFGDEEVEITQNFELETEKF